MFAPRNGSKPASLMVTVTGEATDIDRYDHMPAVGSSMRFRLEFDARWDSEAAMRVGTTNGNVHASFRLTPEEMCDLGERLIRCAGKTDGLLDTLRRGDGMAEGEIHVERLCLPSDNHRAKGRELPKDQTYDHWGRGLIRHGIRGDRFLTAAERDLLQWEVLDWEGQNMIQDLWEPETTETDLANWYRTIDAMGDDRLVYEFNARADGIVHGASSLRFVCDAVRPEVRKLLSDKPYEPDRTETDDDVTAVMEALRDAGLTDPDRAQLRMLARVAVEAVSNRRQNAGAAAVPRPDATPVALEHDGPNSSRAMTSNR